MSHCPAYVEAIHDLELQGRPLGLYLRLYHDHLDAWEYRPVKQLALAAEMRCGLRTVEEGIALLVRLRYIERLPAKPGEVRAYRLAHSRKALDVTAD